MLRGPNNDWPLAFCDYRTVDTEKDIRDHDALRIDRLDELSLLHYNAAHQWYYVASQMPEDAIIFRNADSLGRRSRKNAFLYNEQQWLTVYFHVGAFHAAFDNPDTTSLPRFSAEVRCVAVR